MTDIQFKQCRVCRELKPMDDFYQNKSYSDGKVIKCKICCAEYHKNKPQETKDRDKQRLKEYEYNPERIAYRKKYAQEHQRGSKQEIARKVISHGIRDGIIIKSTKCSISGCERLPIEGHHPDYSKPKEVIWLCRYHHRVEHGVLAQVKRSEDGIA